MTAAQPAIIVVTILFTLVHDSFRVHMWTIKAYTESRDTVVRNRTPSNRIYSLLSARGQPQLGQEDQRGKASYHLH